MTFEAKAARSFNSKLQYILILHLNNFKELELRTTVQLIKSFALFLVFALPDMHSKLLPRAE